MRSPTGPVTADDLAAAVAGFVAALRAGVDTDWSARGAGGTTGRHDRQLGAFPAGDGRKRTELMITDRTVPRPVIIS